jgi:hypothetical protein
MLPTGTYDETWRCRRILSGPGIDVKLKERKKGRSKYRADGKTAP